MNPSTKTILLDLRSLLLSLEGELLKDEKKTEEKKNSIFDKNLCRGDILVFQQEGYCGKKATPECYIVARGYIPAYRDYYGLVSVSSGNSWSQMVEVKNPYKVSPEEFEKMAEKRTHQFRRYDPETDRELLEKLR